MVENNMHVGEFSPPPLGGKAETWTIHHKVELVFIQVTDSSSCSIVDVLIACQPTDGIRDLRVYPLAPGITLAIQMAEGTADRAGHVLLAPSPPDQVLKTVTVEEMRTRLRHVTQVRDKQESLLADRATVT